MKTKSLFVIVAVATFASNSFGQGQVTLGNNAASLVMLTDGLGRPEFPDVPAPVGSVLFQLYYAPGTHQPEWSLNPVGPIVGTSPTVAGRIANTVIDIPTAIVPAGGAATVQIWIWGSSFASYQEAFDGGGPIGKSIIFGATTSAAVLPTSLAGLYPGPSVIVGPVPEPSTFVLVGLGVASLLLYRRRK